MTRLHSILERLPQSWPVILLALPLMVGCGGGDSGQKVANNPPFVQFTGGPTRLESTDGYYSVEARWMGWDYDGEIDHFEYALDPNPDPETPIFTEEEINFPEKTLGAPVRVDRGPEDATDTLYYGKTVDGKLYTFSWIQTRQFSEILNLSTDLAVGDTSAVGSPNATFRYKGRHTLFLRGMDNNGAISQVDYLSTELTDASAGFEVLNVVPQTEISSPKTSTGTVNGSNQFTVHWEGHDPDTRNPDKLPTSYLWKLIQVPNDIPPGYPDPNTMMYLREEYKNIPWHSIRGDTTQVTVLLEGGKQYMFSLRAVDEAGAKEAYLTYSRGSDRAGNTLFITVNNSARPELTVTEKTLGTLVSRGVKSDDFEVPLGTCLRFEWEAHAEDYGGQVSVTNYGLNVPDLDRHGPGSGWNGWREYDQDYVDRNGRYQTLEPICLNKPGVQTFYVKAKDLSGASSIVAFVLNVVEFTFDYPVLYVDDWPDNRNDAVQEKYWLDLLVNSGRYSDDVLAPAIAKYDCWGATEQATDGDALPLQVMGSYRLLLWEVQDKLTTGFSQSGPEKLHVGAFLTVGGQLLYHGNQTIASALGDQDGNIAVGYPFDLTAEIRRGVNSFPYQFLNMFTSSAGNCIHNGNSDNKSDRENLLYVEPVSQESGLPPMRIDPAKTNVYTGNGVNWDFIQDPISEPGWFTGKIDSLYTGHTVGAHLNDKRSSLDGRVCALRVSFPPDDPNPNAHGRVAWFGFPLYYFYQNELQDMMDSVLDWFLEEAPYEPAES